MYRTRIQLLPGEHGLGLNINCSGAKEMTEQLAREHYKVDVIVKVKPSSQAKYCLKPNFLVGWRVWGGAWAENYLFHSLSF